MLNQFINERCEKKKLTVCALSRICMKISFMMLHHNHIHTHIDRDRAKARGRESNVRTIIFENDIGSFSSFIQTTMLGKSHTSVQSVEL
jgi:hypothetical protein